MMEIWCGQAHADVSARQRELFEHYQVAGLVPLQHLDGVVGRHMPWFDVRNPDAIELFAASIDTDHRAIVTCLSGELGRWLRERDIASPHGDLPSGPLPYHAVCVVARTGRTFHVLDPWTEHDHQPLELSFEDFAEIWTGHVLVVARVHDSSAGPALA